MYAIYKKTQGAVDLQETDLDLVKRHWNSKVTANYRQTMNTLKSSGKRQSWVSESVWNDLLTYWNSNEDFLVNFTAYLIQIILFN